jgi:hypothetical protein
MENAPPEFCQNETAHGRCFKAIDEGNCNKDHAWGYVSIIKHYQALEEEQPDPELGCFISEAHEPVDPHADLAAELENESSEDEITKGAEEFFEDANIASGAYEEIVENGLLDE